MGKERHELGKQTDGAVFEATMRTSRKKESSDSRPIIFGSGRGFFWRMGKSRLFPRRRKGITGNQEKEKKHLCREMSFRGATSEPKEKGKLPSSPQKGELISRSEEGKRGKGFIRKEGRKKGEENSGPRWIVFR